MIAFSNYQQMFSSPGSPPALAVVLAVFVLCNGIHYSDMAIANHAVWESRMARGGEAASSQAARPKRQ